MYDTIDVRLYCTYVVATQRSVTTSRPNTDDTDVEKLHLISSHLLFFKKQLSNATVYKLIHIYIQ